MESLDLHFALEAEDTRAHQLDAISGTGALTAESTFPVVIVRVRRHLVDTPKLMD